MFTPKVRDGVLNKAGGGAGGQVVGGGETFLAAVFIRSCGRVDRRVCIIIVSYDVCGHVRLWLAGSQKEEVM